MKILLLPGMDGTGLLFKPFLSYLALPYEVISYPSTSLNSYDSLYDYIKNNIPKEEFFILAESFSGPLAARLISEDIINLKGAIFVASFLNCPSTYLIQFAKYLPLKAMMKLPFAEFFIRKCLIGEEFHLVDFFNAISQVPEKTLKERLIAIEKLPSFPENIYSDKPILFIRADNDWLVSKNCLKNFFTCFSNFSVNTVSGQHFLLQSNPQDCAALIHAFISDT